MPPRFLNSIKEKSNTKFLKFLFLIIGIALLFFSYNRAMKETIYGDFHVFWLAGKTLLESGDLYFTAPGLREFIYPPFAALLFVPLALIPFNISVFVFFILNFILWGICIYLTYRIMNFEMEKDKAINVTFFAALLSFKLGWNNIMMVQSNFIVLFFSLLGIFYFFKKSENYSIAAIACAISTKVSPIFFSFWIVFRGNKVKSFFKFLVAAIICALVPMIIVGPTKAFKDFIQYFNYFFSFFLGHRENTLTYANQSLSGTVLRLFTNLHDAGQPVVTIIDIGIEKAKLLYKILNLFFLVSMLFVFLYRRIKKLKVSLVEPAMVFLVIHLTSLMTWKAHLVSLLFVFAVLISIKDDFKSYLEKKIWLALITFSIIDSLLGQELIGKNGQIYIGSIGIYTWLMFFIYLAFLYHQLVKDKVEN